MKNSSVFRFLLALLLSAVALHTAWSAELRIWTDVKGRTLEARFVRVVDEEVELQLKDGKTAEVKISTLSSADQEYLEEYANVETDVNDPTPAGEPEKDARIDTKLFKKWESDLVLNDSELVFEVLETPNFLILTTGSVRGKDTAENAERLWHGMSFQHPTFRSKFEEKKLAIVVTDEPEVWSELGQYYRNRLREMEEFEAEDQISKTWPVSTSAGFVFEGPLAERYNIFPNATAIHATDRSLERGVWSPFRTHILSEALLRVQIGGIVSFGSEGLLALSKGHAYYKEVSLCGTSVTQLISADSFDSDEVFQRGGFDDGRNWSKIAKTLLRKGAKPDMGNLYAARRDNISAEQIVFIYGLSAFMQSTKGRLAGYAKLVERMDTSATVPEPLEVARIFGHESTEEFHQEWHEWMKTSDFR
ncbi:MAG: SHD1 domain-containing protein [Verrucomicrobiota bacterium]